MNTHTRGNSLIDEQHIVGDIFDEGEFRGKTSTSSQRTLRYNDFELVQKMAQNDPDYAVDLDEGDDKSVPYD